MNYSKFSKKLFKTPFPQPDPSLSGALNATLWQLQGNVFIEFDNLDGGKKRTLVDLNSSLVQDPSGIN